MRSSLCPPSYFPDFAVFHFHGTGPQPVHACSELNQRGSGILKIKTSAPTSHAAVRDGAAQHDEQDLHDEAAVAVATTRAEPLTAAHDEGGKRVQERERRTPRRTREHGDATKKKREETTPMGGSEAGRAKKDLEPRKLTEC